MPKPSPSSSYHKLADVYDHLMADAPYDQWMQFALQAWRYTGSVPKRVAELGCGTGSLTRYLLEHDLVVWGIDLSQEMLEVAKRKLTLSHPQAEVHLLQQDIRRLELDEQMDSVLSFCDTLNYIPDAEGIQHVITHVYNVLRPGGTFLFDVHTPYKIAEVFGDESFSYQDEQVAYIWESTYDKKEEMVEHSLSLFVEEGNGLYRRFHELHRQKAYSITELKNWLEEAGFSVLSITEDFSTQPITDDSERAFFVAQK